MSAQAIDGEPGRCACCRDFHLLSRREILGLPLPVSICRFCADLGDAEVAWRIAGVTEDGFGYEALPDPLRRPPRRRGRDRLAESLLVDEPRYGRDFAGFAPQHYPPWMRARIAWRRVRRRL